MTTFQLSVGDAGLISALGFGVVDNAVFNSRLDFASVGMAFFSSGLDFTFVGDPVFNSDAGLGFASGTSFGEGVAESVRTCSSTISRDTRVVNSRDSVSTVVVKYTSETSRISIFFGGWCTTMS